MNIEIDSEEESSDSDGSRDPPTRVFHVAPGIGVRDTWRNTSIQSQTNALKPNHIFDLNFLHTAISYFISAATYSFYNAKTVFFAIQILLRQGPSILLD